MNALVAIDVAILPPEPIVDLAIRLSAALPPAESKGLVLDGTHRPHITLTQQFVPADEIDVIRHTLATALKGRAPLSLRVRGPGRGASSVWMRIEPTAELADLHRALMDALRPFERRGATAAAFWGGDPRPGDLKWVAAFRRQSSYGQFAPHITLGHASEPPPVDPIAFTGDVVALCHLGRFCACCELFETWRLGSR